jgi:uncharacterized protein YuzE
MLLSLRIILTNMKITYDKTIDAGYVYLSDKPVHKTIPVNEWLVGIEMLDVSLQLSNESLMDLKDEKLKAIPIEVLSCIPSLV